MMRLVLGVLALGCTPPGSRLEVVAKNVPDETSDIRVVARPGEADEAVREARWDGSDPFVFQVLFELEGETAVRVDAIEYVPSESVAATFTGWAILADGTIAGLDQDSFP